MPDPDSPAGALAAGRRPAMSDAEVAMRAGMRAPRPAAGAAGADGRDMPAMLRAAVARAASRGRTPPDGVAERAGLGLARRAAAAAALLWIAMQLVAIGLARYATAHAQQTLPGQLIWAAIGAIVAGAVAWAMTGALARRIGRLGTSIDRLQGGGYRQRVPFDSDDELGRLALRIDRMREAIADREHRLLSLALYDSLTGLPNRMLLIDRIGQAVRDAQRHKREFSLLMLDLDRFKLVNDTLGHGVGDRMLCEVARRLSATVRDADTVARLGGDEFVVLLAGGLDIATEIARRILQALREPMRADGEAIDLGASVGAACYPAHGPDVERLMRHADIAMYQAKRHQCGLVVYDGNDRERERSHLSMLGEMRAALERGEFAIDWQPKLALASGRVAGAEGLIRWNHPMRGRLGPSDFIPFAEETGFVREITRWVIDTGVAQAAGFAREGLSLHVSLNVAAADIQHPQFADDVLRALRRERLDARQLCLEVTESGVLGDLGDALATLHRLDRMGVRLSIDDFGTGYATFSQLQRLPVHEMKIDRSFVSGMVDNRGSEAIVRATIDLARKLGLSVTAEGVETGRELKALAALGCDEVQGFYVAKPMPAAQLTGWVRQRQATHRAAAAQRAG